MLAALATHAHESREARDLVLAEYVFDNAATETSRRFGALEELYDPATIRHLDALVAAGARCLEVGGGSGSIASWMASRAGPEGRVVVTDIDTRFLAGIDAPNVEVRRHNVVTDELDQGAFDVVHTRLVLVHLPEREAVVQRLIGALKPGGWLVLEEFDSLSMRGDRDRFQSEHLLKTLVVMHDMMMARGADVRFGRKLFPILLKAGLANVAAEGRVVMIQGGAAGARLLGANFEQVHDDLLAAGLTEEEFQQDMARLEDEDMVWPSQVMWSVLGQKR